MKIQVEISWVGHSTRLGLPLDFQGWPLLTITRRTPHIAIKVIGFRSTTVHQPAIVIPKFEMGSEDLGSYTHLKVQKAHSGHRAHSRAHPSKFSLWKALYKVQGALKVIFYTFGKVRTRRSLPRSIPAQSHSLLEKSLIGHYNHWNSRWFSSNLYQK